MSEHHRTAATPSARNDGLVSAITKVLNEYRCQHWKEADDGGLALVDVLTPTWCDSIAEGREEIELIADKIAAALSETAAIVQVLPLAPQPEAVTTTSNNCNACGGLGYIQATDGLGKSVRYACACASYIQAAPLSAIAPITGEITGNRANTSPKQEEPFDMMKALKEALGQSSPSGEQPRGQAAIPGGSSRKGDEQGALLRKVITDAQDILARYIVPDSGITEHECVNQLLGLLDGPQTREALSAKGTIIPEAGTETPSMLGPECVLGPLPDVAHTDHPLRHFDRTCPACVEGARTDVHTISASTPSSTAQPTSGPSELEVLRMALGNTAACLGDALATYNRVVGQEVFKNAETPAAPSCNAPT